MAIKIIKNTMVDPIEMKCENCRSVFEYNYQDIQVRKEYSILGFEHRYRVISCPVCKFDNEINKVKAETTGNVAQDH